MARSPSPSPRDLLLVARRSSTALDLTSPPLGGPRRKGLSIVCFGVASEPLVEALRELNYSLSFAADLNDLLWLLARRRVDAIVAMPDDVGIHAVRMLKLEELDDSVRPEIHFMAIQNNAKTPMFFLPMPGEREFTVVLALPDPIYNFRCDRVSVEWVISHLDAESILRGPPS